jgi:hypothetical protein
MNSKLKQATRERKPARGTILDGFWSKPQLAAELGVVPRTVDLWIAQGIGPQVTKAGRFPYFEKRGVMLWLESRRQPMRNVA